MNPDSLHGIPDAQHLTSFVADQEVSALFSGASTARYIEAIDAGNISLQMASGETRTLPFTAGQFRIIQYTAIIASGTTVTGAIVGL